ncbi:hypothetical protein [Alicycliphilus denitrificans]|uniref:hypothetical protein n=1 Tax=Alicycliphilus denitrificans TaxID=179636 RepID=UPI0015E0A365|nr:hypothetical protein [Alicycliphilus denitrificans]
MGVVIGFGIAQRTAMGAQAAAQGFVLFRQVVGRPAFTHGQLGQRGAGAFLGHLAGGFHGVFELGALGFGQGRGVDGGHGKGGVFFNQIWLKRLLDKREQLWFLPWRVAYRWACRQPPRGKLVYDCQQYARRLCTLCTRRFSFVGSLFALLLLGQRIGPAL